MATKDLGIVTAYGYAVAGGYTGTEADFTALLGDLAITVEDLEGMTVSTTTLAPGQPATASYADGVLSLGIPEGLPGVDGEVTNASLAETLADYAKIDGYYEDLTAGNAEQLLSTVQVEDQVPYLFRTSGGSTDIGNREIDKIVGGSVAWNQLAKNGDFTDDTVQNRAWYPTNSSMTIANGELTMTPTARYGGFLQSTVGTIVKNHRYLLMAKVKSGVARQVRFVLSDNTHFTLLGGINSTTSWADYYALLTPVTEVANTVTIGIRDDNSSDFTDVHVKNFVCFDLTQMFGSAIADSLYQMEQANAGSGVALFRSWFPKKYYAYNKGTLMSVKTSAHEMTGFNQWDEEWEVGGINNTSGENSTSTSSFRTKNFIPIISGQRYYCKNGTGSTLGFRYYDANKEFLGANALTGNQIISDYFPVGTAFIRFVAVTATTYNHDICINLSWSGWRNGEYEPYVKHSYPLDNIELRGVPKLDANGDIYFDGDTYESDGTITRRYGIVDLGTLAWGVLDSPYGSFSTTQMKDLAKQDPTAPTYKCSGIYAELAYNTVTSTGDNYIWLNNNKTLIIKDTAKASMSAAEFKAAMSGVYLIYEKATPTTETADPYTNPQIVDDFGTERYVDEREVAVPVGHETEYPANLRDKLQHLPDLASSDGAYLIRQTGHQMSLDLFRIPKAPTTDGTYVLKATVSGGTPTYTWEVEE